MKRIDLHIHTIISDGTLTPMQVIDEASNKGINTIAISDHDTIDAYNNELFEYAKKKNVNLINAVEISTKTQKVGIHVLGYGFDLNNENFRNKLYKIRNARHEYLHNVNEKLNQLEYCLNVEELDKIDAVTKAHIALDIINNEKNRDKLISEFGHIPNKGEFIETIMNENCPAYVRKNSVTPKEAADMIREANGKVVLAHPVAYEHEDSLTDEDILEIIKEMNPDGLEAIYLYVDRNDIMYDETEKWKEFAVKNNLFITMGSDFHNKDNIRPEIGFTNTELSVDDSLIDQIIENVSK